MTKPVEPPRGDRESVPYVTVKTFVIVCLALLGSTAFGQIKPEEDPIQQAFEAMRNHAGLLVTLDGTQQIGNDTKVFKTVAYWLQDIEDGRPMAKIEVTGSLDGVQTFKIVGDGVMLWCFDSVRNEYSSTRYGAYAGAQPNGYLNSLFTSLKSMIKGQSEYTVRLLQETYGGEVARYTTWMPGTAIENTGSVVRYQLGSPVRRRFEFWYTALPARIDRIDYFDEVNFGASARDIDWTVTLVSYDVMLADSSFDFIPPTGARPVTGVRPVTGG